MAPQTVLYGILSSLAIVLVVSPSFRCRYAMRSHVLGFILLFSNVVLVVSVNVFPQSLHLYRLAGPLQPYFMTFF